MTSIVAAFLPLSGCILLLSLLACSGISAEDDDMGQCNAADGKCEKEASRRIEEKTPWACAEKYSEDLIQSSAASHVEHIRGEHEEPHLLVLFGGSGAGKGTFIKHMKSHGFPADDFAFHGLDEYLQYLPEFVKTINDKSAVYKDAADACYGGGAIPIAKATQGHIIAGRKHVIYEETGKNLDRVLKRVLPPFEEAGYRITLVLVDNHADVAKVRAKGRFLQEGRYAPDDYIQGTFKNVPENFKKLRETGKVREAVYCDNSCMNEAASAEDASKMKTCLKCWRDASASADGSFLIPDAALIEGAPRYLNPVAR